MLNWANSYTKRGWSVFPIAERSKLPACEHGFKDASTDPDKVARLWAGREGLNVGIATGAVSGFFVLDVDGPTGEQSLKELCAKHGPLPTTLCSITGKGRHYLFNHIPGLRSSASKIGPSIDIRADGGYIVAPPSIHPSGSAYAWDNPMLEPADAPQWLIDALNAATPARTPASLDIVQPVAPRHRLNLSDWSADDIAKLISHIHPDCDYDQWVNIGMAIKDAGLPFQVWDSWSSKGAKYQRAEMAHKWNSFKGSGITIGSLVYLAKQAGWRPENRPDYAPAAAAPAPAPKSEPLDEFDPVTGEILPATPPVPPAPAAPAPEATSKPRTISYIAAGDITASLDAIDLVKGIVGKGQLSVVYGESNCGKTFFMTDLCFHIALGINWRDCRTERGAVVYVALEGSHGLRNRIAAFRQDRMIFGGFPFIVVPSHINMLDPQGNVDVFIEVLTEIEGQYGKVQMVVIDTLSRALAGGDENTSQDMSAVIYHADKIRAAVKTHVCFVHHSGKDKAKGARGHSSLRAAVDTEIEISRDEGADYSTAKIVKQRDIEIGPDTYFALRKVQLGVNQFDEPVTSCVVEPLTQGDTAPKAANRGALAATEQFVYDSILNALAASGVSRSTGLPGDRVTVTYIQVYEDMLTRGFKDILSGKELTEDEATEAIKKATNSARLALAKKGKISSNRRLIWLTE